MLNHQIAIDTLQKRIDRLRTKGRYADAQTIEDISKVLTDPDKFVIEEINEALCNKGHGRVFDLLDEIMSENVNNMHEDSLTALVEHLFEDKDWVITNTPTTVMEKVVEEMVFDCEFAYDVEWLIDNLPDETIQKMIKFYNKNNDDKD